MKNRVTLILVLLFVMASGCKQKKEVAFTPEELGSDNAIYEKANKYIKKDSEKARLLFKEIIQLYPDSIYARKAKIGIADSYYKQRDSTSLIMAASEYQEFVNLYPNSPDSVYAKAQIASCYEKQSKSPGRDQTNTKAAIKAYENLIKQYPDTQESKEAVKKIKKLKSRLASHYFSIGVSNFRLKAFQGAIVRFKQVIDDYPDFNKNDKLFYFAGKSYYALKKGDSAISFFQKIINSYPKSKYVKKAKKYLKELSLIKNKIEEGKKTEKK
ncbi:MAG: outer membrane protein assembly factor BamD [Acidobacteriota bacterium]